MIGITLISLGLGLFTKGFLYVHDASTVKSYEDAVNRTDLGRLLFFVIDGLRYDFAKEHMRRVLTFSNHSLFYKTISDPPTVTMPRIKAMTTGSIPSFIEISGNFDASNTVKTDSLLYHFKHKGNISVIGDDTWRALYSNLIDKDMTVESLEIYDIDSVDNHIYRNFELGDEVLSIAHFLGVDHASHVYGLNNQVVVNKIHEIDGFIYSVMKRMNENDVLIVCSDHGMTDSGSHGGGLAQEKQSFLFGYCKSRAWNQTISKAIPQYNIVPTLSLLFNMSIPYLSVGTFIPDFFDENHIEELIDIQRKQHEELLISENASSIEEIINRNEFDEKAMIAGILLMCVGVITLYRRPNILPIIHGLAMFSDSFMFDEFHVSLFLFAVHLLTRKRFMIALITRCCSFSYQCRKDCHKRVCQPSLTLPFIPHVWFFLIAPMVRDPVSQYFISILGFLFTRHQYQLGSLHFETAFLFGRYIKVISPLIVFLDTFVFDIYSTSVCNDVGMLLFYKSFTLLCMMLFSYYARNHLMIWQLIAPRFIFQSISTLVSLVYGKLRTQIAKAVP